MDFYKWSWRDSNPRPNKQYASFLHAYSVIGFHRKAENRHPTLRLSSLVFVPEPKSSETYFRIAIPQTQTSRNKTSVEHLASVLSSGNC